MLKHPPALTATVDELRDALSEGNLPTLLLVLERLTGDSRWLADPFRPSRTIALDDNDDGGFPPAIQDEIRSAALEALRAWREDGAPALDPPSDEQIPELLSFSLGERVPAEYAGPMAEEAGFRPRAGVRWTHERPARTDDFHVLVIGAGPSGICVGATLERLGIPYTVVERNEAPGGVWEINDYPGAGVDTPTHMYSFSFAPRRGWQRFYAKQPEILDYLQRVADEHGVSENTRFRTEVASLEWDDAAAVWRAEVRTPDGETELIYARAVISCAGQLSLPFVPDLEGLDRFQGPAFHSSRWDHGVDVTGKRVAVIGTGATSMQITPAIAETADRVLVFQRSPQWVVPNSNYLRDVPERVLLLMEQVPFYADFYRLRLIWQFQDKLLETLRRDPEWEHPERSVNAVNDKHRIYFTQYLERALGDRADLKAKALPDYPPYGKRILMDNRWFDTIQRDDVELIAEGVCGLDEHHVLTADGDAHEVDVVVLATGFQTRRLLDPMHIVGRDGRVLREQWGDDDASAHLGVTVPGFPNFFLVGGPYTALGHGGSAITISECVTAYIAQILIAMNERDLASVEVRADALAAYEAAVDAEHEQLIWTHPGMTNWYRNAAGRVVVPMPWRGVDFARMTSEPAWRDFNVRATDAVRR